MHTHALTKKKQKRKEKLTIKLAELSVFTEIKKKKGNEGSLLLLISNILNSVNNYTFFFFACFSLAFVSVVLLVFFSL